MNGERSLRESGRAAARNERKMLALLLLIAVAITMAPATAVRADAFGPVRYDPKSDQLIVTILYDGTNPDHHFSIQWEPCHKLEQTRGQPEQPGLPPHYIALSIMDDQGNDAAKKSYRKTIRVPLAASSCRPARVTLVTSPVLYNDITIDIP
jgi:hypothetical protein